MGNNETTFRNKVARVAGTAVLGGAVVAATGAGYHEIFDKNYQPKETPTERARRVAPKTSGDPDIQKFVNALAGNFDAKNFSTELDAVKEKLLTVQQDTSDIQGQIASGARWPVVQSPDTPRLLKFAGKDESGNDSNVVFFIKGNDVAAYARVAVDENGSPLLHEQNRIGNSNGNDPALFAEAETFAKYDAIRLVPNGAKGR